MRRRYIQKTKPDGTNYMVEVTEQARSTTHHVMGDIEAFVSPINGQVINTRSQLERHMREHNVAPTADFKDHWANKEAQRRSPRADAQAKRERVEAIKGAAHRLEHGYRDFPMSGPSLKELDH